MKKVYYIAMLLLFVLLAGCNNSDGNSSKQNNLSVSAPVVDTPVVQPNVVPKKSNNHFPDEALAIPPASLVHSENGRKVNTKMYFLSIVMTEKIGLCFSRRVEVRGTFEKNQSGNWSVDQSQETTNKNKNMTVKVQEDTTACGGKLLVFTGSTAVSDASFKINKETKSVYFYADVNVYQKNGVSSEDVSIAIDSTQIAKGDFSGGSISTSESTQWSSEFDAKSNTQFEGVNIILNGGIYINSLAVSGVTHAKISRQLSDYNDKGVRPVDPFIENTQTGGGMG